MNKIHHASAQQLTHKVKRLGHADTMNTLWFLYLERGIQRGFSYIPDKLQLIAHAQRQINEK